jgi:ribonucleoside-diphosphate reductase alpha chain
MGKLSDNALKIAENRYFMEGEDWNKCSQRVGVEVAGVENGSRAKYEQLFSEMVFNMDFLPGGRILRNARRARGSMFNCYVLPVGDSIEEIGQWKKDALILWSEGGGVGCNVSSLRPRGSAVKGKGGSSSGPVSFLEASNGDAKTIESGGSRRAAALACMNVSHPDVMEFIDAKLVHGRLSHYNISVAVVEKFLEAVETDSDWEFKFAQQSYGTIKAREIWEKIMTNAVNCAEPGLLNWDNLTSNNSYYFEPILATNPSLRAGTKILTNLGIIPIDELENNHFTVPNINGAYSDAECFLSGAGKQLYRITLQGGYEYFATAEHKWPVVSSDRWNYCAKDFYKKRTNELQAGDYLPQPNKKLSLVYGDSGCYEDGFLIGWNIGDGWISNNDRPNQIGFIVSEKDQEYKIHNILSNKLKDLGWSGEFKNRNGNKETNIQNSNVRNFFEFFGVTKKDEGIPKAIWNTASESFRKGFIDALFSSDGSVSTKIILVSSHKNLIYDVAELLGFYGIQSSIKYSSTSGGVFPNGKSYDKIYDRYQLTISRQSSICHFHKTFKLTHGGKQESLNRLVSSYKLIPPMNAIKIISVEKTDLFEDVWDITVHDDIHCFELSQVITGNCGEVPLGGYSVCNLGSLVLPNFITGNVNTNWKKLETTIKLAIRFLDDVIEVNKYILKEIDINAHNARRVGLGVMGLAEYLFAKKLRYGSEKAVYEVERLMRFIRDAAYQASIELAMEKGAFPKFDPVQYGKAHFVRTLPASVRMEIKSKGIRNVTMLAMAPTGTISLLPEVSSGIEPLFSKAYLRSDRVSERMYVHPLYKELLKSGDELPDWFVETSDLKPSDHFETQSVIQKYVDGAVSKTINLPAGTTPKQLSKLTLEYIRDLKGVTVYVDGSREGQILNNVSSEQVKKYLKDEEQKTKSSMDVDAMQCATGSCEI